MKVIPQHLRRALEDRKLVFVCGAGVSIPAGLPSFKCLVQKVLTDLLPSKDLCRQGSTEQLAWMAFEHDRYDEALDILETPRAEGFEPKQVRECVRRHLSKPKTKTLDKHLILARLADLDRPYGRIVTTNFDNLFENALNKLKKLEKSPHKLVPYIAPALPPAKPESSFGLIYLHGKLGHSQNDRDLVLTMADFGSAYLLEGWARRFVIEMFRHYHVIFIGYRVEDPTMRYLVSALAAAREANRHFNEAYAFAPYGDDGDVEANKKSAEQEWHLKGLVPLPYSARNGHDELWGELENWADDHRQGTFGRRQSVARLGKFPPVDENDPAIAELTWALSDQWVAKHFGGLSGFDRPHPGWIEPLHKAGLFSSPVTDNAAENNSFAPAVSRSVSDNTELNKCTFHLIMWIIKCLETPEAVNWAIGNGSVLHRDLRWRINNRLTNDPPIPTAFGKFWRVLADDDYAYALSLKAARFFSGDYRIGPKAHFGNRVFMERLKPIPVFRQVSQWFVDRSRPRDVENLKDWYSVDIELVGIEHVYEIEEFQKHAENWHGALAALAHDITTKLSEALEWLAEFELASGNEDHTYIEFRSISPHEQNKHAHTWTCLISLARDSYDALLITGDIEGATRLARRWQSFDFPIFRRLALYAATGGLNA